VTVTSPPPTLSAFLFGAGLLVTRHRPWPRVELTPEQWRGLIALLPATGWELLALWAEPDQVHAALADRAEESHAVVSLACPEGRFPSLSAVRPGAIRMERAARDLFGLEPEGLVDARPWLDHGRWRLRRPLARAPEPAALDEPPARAADYPFLPVEGEGLHQIPVGPVHAGIIEPGHFRFTAAGEAVARLEARLGYVHRGIEGLMQGRMPAEGAPLAARISGDSTVAHALAFARATEAATGIEAPPRAQWLRGVMAELERIANHLGDFGAICNDAAFALIHNHAAALREETLRLAASVFGHRLMMDRIVPGGVAVDLYPAGAGAIRDHLDRLAPRLDRLVAIYDARPSLLDRTLGTGVIAAHLVARFAAGGFVGRASGRAIDARKAPGYPPYDALDFEVPALAEGDVHARAMIRVAEIGQSIRLIRQMLDRLPEGPTAAALPAGPGEGMAIVEGFRGDILTWVRLDASGRIARCHPRDPSWLHWPLVEAAIEGNIVADFPLCNKSVNASYAGHDL